ncbi:MAG: DNA polymerase III subunit beta [Planctomycetaceae bacterium]|jgi:DNA polymerase-3 subunit beta|nr:DNA polymerase III subunit beta [Planctomycetaceae bacterium]
MKITCNRAKFLQQFQVAASVAAARDVRPILQNVKIKVTKKNVLLQATDTEVGIRLIVDDCEVHKTGEAVLPAKRLKLMLSESTAETVEIESADNKIIFKVAGKADIELDAWSPDEFPDVEDFEEKSYLEIPASTFSEMIRRTIFATDSENARYALGGILLEFQGDKITAVATDGKRLAFLDGAAVTTGEMALETAILPSKAMAFLERVLSEDEQPVKVGISQSRAIFKFQQAVFFTRLVEGKFPKWRSIVPETEGRTQIDILAGALLPDIRLADTVSTDYNPGIVFIFENGKMTLKGSGNEVGKSSVETAISYTGEKVETKLDPKFVKDFLRVLPADKLVSLYFASGEPVLAKTDDDYTYIVMPMS